MKEMVKDSGIAWIGEIPEHWEVLRMQDVALFKKGPFGSAITIDMFVERAENTFKVYEQKNAIQKDSTLGHYYISAADFNNLKSFCVQPGDIIVSCAGTIGCCYILPTHIESGIINQALMRVRINKQLNKLYFLSLFDLALEYMGEKYSNGSAIKNIPPFSVLKKQYICVPTLTEQRTIAAFLDDVCAKIDGIIADLEHQVDLLKDYKKSLITETVTKGLDKHVKLKDSGITWIGEIPEHWKVTKVKFLSSYIGSGTTPDSAITEYYDGTNPWIQSGDLYKTSIISKTEKLVTNLAIKNFSALKIYKAPFVVIAMYGASVGNVSVSHINACVNQACCVIITSHELNHLYLYYWLTVCKEDFDINAIGGGQPNISQQVIKNQYLLKVPLLEQQAIASFLDTRCAKIDSVIKGKEEQIEQQKEYKKSLIYEYVTGKKRVKEVY